MSDPIQTPCAHMYQDIPALIAQIHEPYRSGLLRLYGEHDEILRAARGSSHNHQAWEGGYLDHIAEVMNLAVVLYASLGALRPMPFSLSDALVVLFVHDLEKPWAYEKTPEGWRRREGFGTKDFAQAFRLEKLAEAGVCLTPELASAVACAEGELHLYSNRARAMSPLAAFCHMCDVASARLWYDHPLAQNDPWPGASRTDSPAA